MSSPVIEMLSESGYVSKQGTFDITLSKKQLTPSHNYWLYFINASNPERGNLAFTLLATKQGFVLEELADHLARTLGIAEAKARLDQANDGGKPIRPPFLTEGWVLL